VAPPPCPLPPLSGLGFHSKPSLRSQPMESPASRTYHRKTTYCLQAHTLKLTRSSPRDVIAMQCSCPLCPCILLGFPFLSFHSQLYIGLKPRPLGSKWVASVLVWGTVTVWTSPPGSTSSTSWTLRAGRSPPPWRATAPAPLCRAGISVEYPKQALLDCRRVPKPAKNSKGINLVQRSYTKICPMTSACFSSKTCTRYCQRNIVSLLVYFLVKGEDI